MQITSGGIGFFDSGIGGLTVLNACRRLLPDVPFYYLGDNARAPYGNLSPRVIREYTYQALSTLADCGVRAVVLACNTVTAVCVEELRGIFPFPIIGSEPAVAPAARVGGRVGVLTTRATGESARFIRLCTRVKAHYESTEIIPLICDGLAGAIERNIDRSDFCYAPYLPKAQVDGVVLGCTHYVYIKKKIQNVYRCPTYDGNDGIARRLFTVLYGKIPDNASTYTGSGVVKKNAPVFFLGGQKEYNQSIYEHLFVQNRGASG